jgi:hypothetical protein
VQARRGARIKTVRHADAARRKPKICFTLLGCERPARHGDGERSKGIKPFAKLTHIYLTPRSLMWVSLALDGAPSHRCARP